MKIVRICMIILATLNFASIAAAQCGPARPKTTAGAGSLEEMIVAQETSIIESVKKGDTEAFKAIVDVNGTVVDSQGIRKIGDVIPELFGPDIKFSEYTLNEPQVRTVDKNTAIIHYKSKVTVTVKGKSYTGSNYETTIFVRRVGKWVAVFHQSSEVAPSPATGT